MNAQATNGTAPEPVTPGATAAGEALIGQMMGAAGVLVAQSRGTNSAAEAKDYAQAVLFYAQAITTLDPTRIEGGDDPAAKKASTPTPSIRDTDRDGKTGES